MNWPRLPKGLLSACSVLAALLCAFPVLAVEPANETSVLRVGGLDRSYRLHIPLSHKPKKKAPLLIVLHGGFGKGSRIEAKTGFNSVARKEKFLVVYPDAFEGHWNDGRGVRLYRAQRDNVDDVAFLTALVAHLSEQHKIDPRRIYVTGFSNGAMMALRLACEAADKITAVAAVAGAMPANMATHCRPSRRIPVMMINGTEDRLILWQGGDIRVRAFSAGRALSVPRSVNLWVNRNSCNPAAKVSLLPNKDKEDGTRVQRLLYDRCRNRADVVLLRVNGGGHTWPGSDEAFPRNLLGNHSRDFNASETIWRFLKSYRR